MSRLSFFAVAAVTAVVLVAGGPAGAGYYYGFEWDRSADWDPGSIHGSSAGNPNTDAEGNPVWSLESTHAAGDGLGGVNPWYEGATQLQVWDDSWYGGGPTWARGDNVNPPISSSALTHNISSGGLHSHVPLVRWVNPVPRPFPLEIAGTLTEQWRGGGGLTDNVDFDVVIAHYDASAMGFDVLYGEAFEKPSDNQLWESLSADVHLLVPMEPGDELVISHRGHHPASRAAWPSLADDLTLTMKPEPATLSVLGLGVLGLLRRRRSR
ncbi:MAG: PEP-CTERM sorting domain-containing protein [Planctomycetota bacterium]